MWAQLCASIAGAWAWDDSKYPDFSERWRPIGGPGRFARDQKPPLTPEYQAMFDYIKSEGGQGTNNMTYLCFSPGMPRATNGYGEMEFVIAPTTFHIYDNRRIFTDGRPWPEPLTPTSWVIRSAVGSRPGTVNTTCSRSRRAASAVPALSTPAASRQ